ncbi:hypothetical protein BKA66DRAFT_570447 [Pyrenochaeta sp. MPI-SDFR-AT-0127]|nr:hypothetical protein BKA66DRAFT_570447 [Pyrenochaeta sp. MPI-SDFR-AT-0127]
MALNYSHAVEVQTTAAYQARNADPISFASEPVLLDKTKSHGLRVWDCGGNLVCYTGEDCCTDGPTYYVNPYTGEVKDGSRRDSTASPTWWSIDSAAILASSTPTTSSVLVSHSATLSLTTPSPSSVIPVSSSPSATASSSPERSQQPSPGLSAAAGAGIGVGSAVGVAGVAVLAWLFLRRRKRRLTQRAQAGQQNNVQGYQHPGADKDRTHDFQGNTPLQELDQGRPRQEME